MFIRTPIGAILSGLALACASAPAVAEHVRIAFIETLSGPMSPPGHNQIKNYRLLAETANREKWAGEHTLEFVPFDNKGNPQEALIQFRHAVDQGFRYIAQGNSSAVGHVLIDAVNKHNERDPGREVLYLNFAAVDPSLTNEKCSFWHFRFDANSDMKLEVLTSHLASDRRVSRVYIIGQNYALGHQVSRAAKEYLKRKRPDVQIVGDDLHPIGQVKDFSPYIAKIRASGADTIVTGNWGADLALLVKAAKEAELKANFYTLYANTNGVPTAMALAGIDNVKVVSPWHANNEIFAGREITEAMKSRYNEDFIYLPVYTSTLMLARAIRESRSTDPYKVALAMEGMKIHNLNGTAEMRATDHQLQQPLYIAAWSKTDGKTVRFDQESTGYGWKTEKKLESYVAAQPTSCQMKRPALAQ